MHIRLCRAVVIMRHPVLDQTLFLCLMVGYLCWISKPSCLVYPTNQSKVIKIRDQNPLETLRKTCYISCKGSVCRTSCQQLLFLFSDFLKCHGSVVHSLIPSDFGHICGSDILHIITTCFLMQVEQSEHVIRM